MRAKLTGVILLYLFSSSSSYAKWSKLNDFGGDARVGAVSFSINGKGYLGTGGKTREWKPGQQDKGNVLLKDFWEYDPAKDTWTQKADFAGAEREGAVGFSIGDKGYLGTGFDNRTRRQCTDDFWEFNPATNAWTRKADFGGGPSHQGIGFSIGQKGYIGLASGNDLWEYDPATDRWSKKKNMPIVNLALQAPELVGFISFTIDNKAYIGLGRKRVFVRYDGGSPSYNTTDLDKMYQYDPATDVWTKLKDFPGGRQSYRVAFAIGTKGYILAQDKSFEKNALWEYNPKGDAWVRKANFESDGVHWATAFVIAERAYICTGSTSKGNSKEVWAWD